MSSRACPSVPACTRPAFAREALETALELAQYSPSELADMLRVSHKIAAENCLRYRDFASDACPSVPALCAYTGAVFKRIAPDDFSADDFRYAQAHLNITSFLYGLLRPLDLIHNYRLEGDAVLPDNGGQSMFAYWQSRLTGLLLERVKADDGILVNLASEEMKRLFDWKRVCREVKVITPEFRVWKGDKLRSIVVYTKMCRGEMTRYLLKGRITDPEALKAFTWEGFRWDDAAGMFTL